MKTRALIVAVLCAAANAVPITHEHYFADVTRLPPDRVKACRDGCYVLTHEELMSGLQAARRAALRSGKP